MKHWQTTILGILVILATLAHVGIQYIAKAPIDWSAVSAGLLTGLALIRGADASKVDAIMKKLSKE